MSFSPQLHIKPPKLRERFMLYDCPFGGKIDGCIVPSLDMRTHFNVERYDHDPSQRSRKMTLFVSVKSGRSANSQHNPSSIGKRRQTEAVLELLLVLSNLDLQKIFPCRGRSSCSALLLQGIELFFVLVHKAIGISVEIRRMRCSWHTS